MFIWDVGNENNAKFWVLIWTQVPLETGYSFFNTTGKHVQGGAVSLHVRKNGWSWQCFMAVSITIYQTRTLRIDLGQGPWVFSSRSTDRALHTSIPRSVEPTHRPGLTHWTYDSIVFCSHNRRSTTNICSWIVTTAGALLGHAQLALIVLGRLRTGAVPVAHAWLICEQVITRLPFTTGWLGSTCINKSSDWSRIPLTRSPFVRQSRRHHALATRAVINGRPRPRL